MKLSKTLIMAFFAVLFLSMLLGGLYFTFSYLRGIQIRNQNSAKSINQHSSIINSPTPTTTISISATPTTSSDKNDFYSVTKVVDGDTIEIEQFGKLRLIGVNTPEVKDPRKPVECYGAEASQYMKDLLKNHKVRIDFDSTQDKTDKYGRYLVYLTRDDGLFINKNLIEEGYAYEYTYQIPYIYQKEFKAAEQSAKANKKGLWNPDTCNGLKIISTPSPK